MMKHFLQQGHTYFNKAIHPIMPLPMSLWGPFFSLINLFPIYPDGSLPSFPSPHFKYGLLGVHALTRSNETQMEEFSDHLWQMATCRQKGLEELAFCHLCVTRESRGNRVELFEGLASRSHPS